MTEVPPLSPRKLTGLAHLQAAFGYSLGGATRLTSEAAFRQEILSCAAAVFLFMACGAAVYDYIVLTILFLLLIAVEALNTAIEEIVDRISPEISLTGRHAKDLGSFAVFCLLAANGTFVAFTVLMATLL